MPSASSKKKGRLAPASGKGEGNLGSNGGEGREKGRERTSLLWLILSSLSPLPLPLPLPLPETAATYYLKLTIPLPFTLSPLPFACVVLWFVGCGHLLCSYTTHIYAFTHTAVRGSLYYRSRAVPLRAFFLPCTLPLPFFSSRLPLLLPAGPHAVSLRTLPACLLLPPLCLRLPIPPAILPVPTFSFSFCTEDGWNDARACVAACVPRRTGIAVLVAWRSAHACMRFVPRQQQHGLVSAFCYCYALWNFCTALPALIFLRTPADCLLTILRTALPFAYVRFLPFARIASSTAACPSSFGYPCDALLRFRRTPRWFAVRCLRLRDGVSISFRACAPAHNPFPLSRLRAHWTRARAFSHAHTCRVLRALRTARCRVCPARSILARALPLLLTISFFPSLCSYYSCICIFCLRLPLYMHHAAFRPDFWTLFARAFYILFLMPFLLCRSPCLPISFAFSYAPCFCSAHAPLLPHASGQTTHAPYVVNVAHLKPAAPRSTLQLPTLL